MTKKIVFRESKPTDKESLRGFFMTQTESIDVFELLNTLTEKQLNKLINRTFKHIRMINGSD